MVRRGRSLGLIPLSITDYQGTPPGDPSASEGDTFIWHMEVILRQGGIVLTVDCKGLIEIACVMLNNWISSTKGMHTTGVPDDGVRDEDENEDGVLGKSLAIALRLLGFGCSLAFLGCGPLLTRARSWPNAQHDIFRTFPLEPGQVFGEILAHEHSHHATL